MGLKAIESKAVSCRNIPIKRSDPGLIFRNKQTSGKPKMASYSRRRQMWSLAGCTGLWCSSLAQGCPRRGLLISATILGFWQLEFLPSGQSPSNCEAETLASSFQSENKQFQEMMKKTFALKGYVWLPSILLSATSDFYNQIMSFLAHSHFLWGSGLL